MEETTPTTPDWIDMGAWVGRQQAFAVIAKKCSAAQALSLKEMKEARGYEKLGLSWDDFCQQHAGISRVHADRIIGQYDEFGEAYFRLSSLARISPEGYREIIDNVMDNCLEIDGRQVPIVPENASIIRAFIRACRSQRRAGAKDQSSVIPDLELRLHAILQDIKQVLRPNLPLGIASRLKDTVYTAIREWDRITRRLEELDPHNR
ncbi:MAG: hypothetical protein ACLQU1_36220 [Bryobacteraceae bacterium]